MQPIAGGRANESPGWASASSSPGCWEYPNTAPAANQPGPESPTIAVAITGREFQRGPDSVVFHWVTRHSHGRNGAVANLTVDAVEVILEKAVLKGRTIRRKRMTAVPTHRSMAADAVFARVGGILVRNGQGGMPNRISPTGPSNCQPNRPMAHGSSLASSPRGKPGTLELESGSSI